MRNKMEKRVRQVLEGTRNHISTDDVAEIVQTVGLLNRSIVSGKHILYRAQTPDAIVNPDTKMPVSYVLYKEYLSATPDVVILVDKDGEIEYPLIAERQTIPIRKDDPLYNILKYWLQFKDEFCSLRDRVTALETIQRKIYQDELKRRAVQEAVLDDIRKEAYENGYE